VRLHLLVALATFGAGSATAQTPPGIPKFPLPTSPLDLEGPARAGEYLGDVGRRAALFGDETGGFEVWTWPVKLVRDLTFAFRIPDYDQPIEAAKVARRVIVHPAYKTIVYSHPTFTVRAHVMAALDEPGALILLDVDAVHPLDVIVRLNADFNLAWPGSFGGQHIGWDAARRAFVLTQGGIRSFNGVVASPAATSGTSHAAHDAPAFPSQFTMTIDTAMARTSFLPIVIAGGAMPQDSVWAAGDRILSNARELVEAKAAHYRAIAESLVSIESPDPAFDRAFEWAKVNLDRQRVCNPDLGCGLVAGYGKAGPGNFRPGFGWYFGGDAAINSFAMDALGQFDLVREGLSFLGRYQRTDGKIPHEISHAAARLPWWTDYPYTWYHGDTTPYWILACAEYWRASGDRGWIDGMWDKLLLAYRWSKQSDTDGDGLMENPTAGAGAIEVGGLGDALHTDIYLAGVWVSALDGLRALAIERGDTAMVTELTQLHARAKASLEQRFWIEPSGRYAFALLQDGPGKTRLNDALTVWPATAMAFGQLDADRSRRMLAQIAGSDITTDWGVRTLDRNHRLYEPLHYNNGAVWPFVTGFAAWAHYQTRRGWAGFDLLRDIARTGDDFALGVQPELMSAAFYDPLDTAMPDQFFSTSMLVSPLLRGLVGFRADATRCRVTLAPQLPADWDRFTVRRLPAGCGKLDMAIRREADRLLIDLRRSDWGRPLVVALEPSLPLGATIVSVSVDGKAATYRTVGTPHDVSPSFELAVTDSARVEIRYAGGAELVPQQTRPLPGDPSRGLRLLDWREERGRFVAVVEGSGEQQFRVRSALPLRVVEGGRVAGRTGPFTTVAVPLAAASERRRVVLAP
jgi:glycogen debranching enzyme